MESGWDFSGETVIGAPGSSLPAKIVVSLLEEFHQVDQLERQVPLQEETICSLSGALAGPFCPYSIESTFIEGTELSECQWHNEDSVVLPSIYSQWIERQKLDIKVNNAGQKLEIIQPVDGAQFFWDPTLPEDSQIIPVRVIGSGSATLSINDKIVYQGESPFTYHHPIEKGVLTIALKSGSTLLERKVLVR